MVTDRHGHYTSEPFALLEYRKDQISALKNFLRSPRRVPNLSAIHPLTGIKSASPKV